MILICWRTLVAATSTFDQILKGTCFQIVLSRMPYHSILLRQSNPYGYGCKKPDVRKTKCLSKASCINKILMFTSSLRSESRIPALGCTTQNIRHQSFAATTSLRPLFPSQLLTRLYPTESVELVCVQWCRLSMMHPPVIVRGERRHLRGNPTA